MFDTDSHAAPTVDAGCNAEFEAALAAALDAEADTKPDAEDAFFLALMDQWSAELNQLPHDLESQPADGNGR